MSNIIVIMPPEYKQYLYTDLPQEVTLIGYKEMEMTGTGLDSLFETMRDRGYEIPEDAWAIDELKVVNDEYIYLKFK